MLEPFEQRNKVPFVDYPVFHIKLKTKLTFVSFLLYTRLGVSNDKIEYV